MRFLHRSVVIGAQSSSRSQFKLAPFEKVQNLDDCYHRWARREIELLLPPTASRILDVGAGVGTTSRWLKDRYNGAFALALEGNPDLLGELRQNVDEAHIVDLNGSLPDVGAPDLVLFLDVLEHLLHPGEVLARLTANMPANGTVVVSLPNVAHWSVSLPLFLKGRFQYADAGLLDRTHLRFFTRQSAIELVNSAGFMVTKGARTGFGPRTRIFDRLTFGIARDHLTYQYLMAGSRFSGKPLQTSVNWRTF
jgi:2-polyprenyl-3-methyl-5-hydroxy-6-metoxy-1,4-benzoquinol methylase